MLLGHPGVRPPASGQREQQGGAGRLLRHLPQEQQGRGLPAGVRPAGVPSLHAATSHLLRHLPQEHQEQCLFAGVRCGRVPALLPSASSQSAAHLLRHLPQQHQEQGLPARVRCS